MRLNLQKKLALGLLLPTCLLLLLFVALCLYAVNQARDDGGRLASQMEARRLATELTATLQAAAQNATNLAAVLKTRPDLSDADFKVLLEEQLRQTPSQFGAGIRQPSIPEKQSARALYVSGHHDLLTSAQADLTHAVPPEWLQQARASGQAGWTAPYFDQQQGNTWMVSYAVPVLRDGRFEGATVADVAISTIAKVWGDRAPSNNWLLIDQGGRIIYAAESRLYARPYTDWAPADSERARFIAAALSRSDEQTRRILWPDEQIRLSSSAPIPFMGWVLVYGAPPMLLEGRNLSLPVLAWVSAALSMLILFFLYRTQQAHLKPLRQLVSKVAQLVAGEPSQPVRLRNGDEVTALSEGISTLTQQLRGREQHLISRQRELADRMREQQVLYRVADTLGWVDYSFTEMLDRVTALLPEAWPRPDQMSCRINIADYQSDSENFRESQRGLFAPIEPEAGGGGVWVFAANDSSTLEAGQQELIEGVAQQLGLAYRRELAQQQLEQLNRELEQRVELRTEALRTAERLLRDITNSMPGAVFQIMQHPLKAPELRFVSAGVESVLGISRDRALASHDAVMALVFPEDLAGLNAVIATAVGRRQPYSHVHRISHGRSGEVRWIRAAATTVLEPDGGVLLNGYWIDVTDQKELELALEQARLEADAANEAKGRFLANMSHEIRTPMNAIIGLTHLAALQTQEQKVRDQLNKVEDSAKALLGLLNDILDFSKIEAGRMAVERIPFDLWGVLDRVQALMSERAGEKGLQFNVWRVPDLPRDLMGDPLRVHQVLLNLVSNAVKFTESGSVTLNCTVIDSDDGFAALNFEISDTGVGIDPIQMTRLFNAFTQADNSTTRRFGGTGLGLTICKELITLMGGTIGVESTPGSGSTFTVKLGFDRADPSWRDALSSDLDMPQTDPLLGARVLVVDDNAINLEIAGELLRQAHVEVVTACNGREALDKIEQSEYDAVLMDLQMPVMDGLAAAMELRRDERYADLPIIAMTANAMTGDRERCIEAGMNDHIPKPIDPAELRRTLSRWLRRRASGDLASTIPPPRWM